MDALTLEWENFRSELFEIGAPHSVQGEAVEGTLSINAAALSETLHSWLEASEAGEMREDLALKLLASIVPETIQPHLQKASDAMDEFEFPRH